MKRSKSLSPEPSCSLETKRVKVEDESKVNGKVPHPSLLDFSDDVLLNILKYLYPQDLMTLSLCCQRLSQVTQDRTLWKNVDFRLTPMLMHELHKYIKFLQPMTNSLAIRGHVRHRRTGTASTSFSELSLNFLRIINTLCDQLKELIIEDYWISGDKIQITEFPKTIEKLSLKGCDMGHLQSNKSYFFKMDLHMPNLTCLILSNCQWFTPHSLLVISKISKLKELRLNSCHRLGECVAYASLATRFGFKTLEILDLRDTALGDSEVGCFSSTKTLKHLYLECPSILRNPEPSDNSKRPRQQPHQQQQLEEEESPQQPIYEDGILRLVRRRPQPVYEDRILRQCMVDDDFSLENHGYRYRYERCLISDRAIRALFSDTCDRRVINNSPQGIIVLEEDKQIFNNPQLKTLVVRNYSRVTNVTLAHLGSTASSLEYLDVTGTSVTKGGLRMFKSQKPNVTVISSFDET